MATYLARIARIDDLSSLARNMCVQKWADATCPGSTAAARSINIPCYFGAAPRLVFSTHRPFSP
jgi:hypothetical protein